MLRISTGKTLTEYDDGYVTISGSVYKVDSAAILYNKDSDGDLDKKISRSKLNDYEGKVIDFAIEDGILVAAVVYDGEKPDNGDGDVDAGKVTYINSTFTKVVVDGKTTYTFDSNTEIYDEEGNIIAVGYEDIEELSALEVGDLVKDIKVKDGVVVSLVLVEPEV
ncbi:MAG: hypothetical protein ACOX15_09370 [Tepidanaerobacteraceae bacterium]